MNALELCKKLEESGTGAEKFAAARHAAKERNTTLKAMSGEDLLDMMSGRRERWLAKRDVLAGTGGQQTRGAEQPSQGDPPLWPEGTILKARRLLDGLPADAPLGHAAGAYDVDEAPPEGAPDESKVGVPNPAGPETTGGPHGPAPSKHDSDRYEGEVKKAHDQAKDAPPPPPAMQKMSQPPQPPKKHGKAADDESHLPGPPK